MNSPGRQVPNMLLEISGKITPERMKGWSQSKNNTQLQMGLVVEARFDAVKSRQQLDLIASKKTHHTYSTNRCGCSLVAKQCLTPFNPVNCSPPGSSVHGISQASILEYVVISFSKISRDLPDPGIKPVSSALQVNCLLLSPWGSLHKQVHLFKYQIATMDSSFSTPPGQ